MTRRIRALYVPRSGSEWGELAGSALYVYRPYSYRAIDPHTGQPVTVLTFSFSHSVNLEEMESA